MPRASKSMKELWKIKRELSKETIKMTWPEMKAWLDEGKKKWDEDMKRLREGKEKEAV